MHEPFETKAGYFVFLTIKKLALNFNNSNHAKTHIEMSIVNVQADIDLTDFLKINSIYGKSLVSMTLVFHEHLLTSLLDTGHRFKFLLRIFWIEEMK